jgi:peroxiredoxin
VSTNGERLPIRPGDPAPEFSLPAVDGEGSVSLAHFRGTSPVYLALFRGLY